MENINMQAIKKQLESGLTISTGSIYFTGGLMNPKVIKTPSTKLKKELGEDLCVLGVGPGTITLMVGETLRPVGTYSPEGKFLWY